MFYYVKIYMNVFHVPHVWFNIAQTLFMFWNAINDPLFGYLQVSAFLVLYKLLNIKELSAANPFFPTSAPR